MKCIIYKKTGGAMAIGMFCRVDGSSVFKNDAEVSAHAETVAAADPEILSFRIGDSVDLPGGTVEGRFDKSFRNAFTDDLAGKQVDIDIPRAQNIAHDRRRVKRAARFAPLDIEATIPAKAEQAEAARQDIRDEDDALQIDIDAATTPEALKAIMGAM